MSDILCWKDFLLPFIAHNLLNGSIFGHKEKYLCYTFSWKEAFPITNLVIGRLISDTLKKCFVLMSRFCHHLTAEFVKDKSYLL